MMDLVRKRRKCTAIASIVVEANIIEFYIATSFGGVAILTTNDVVVPKTSISVEPDGWKLLALP
jgi:hypothetical protein